jgi:hypothetical protein
VFCDLLHLNRFHVYYINQIYTSSSHFISILGYLCYAIWLLGQKSRENCQPRVVEEAPLSNEVLQFFNDYSHRKCLLFCFTWIDWLIDFTIVTLLLLFISSHSHHYYWLLGQNSRENRKPVKAVEPLSKCFLLCFTWIDIMNHLLKICISFQLLVT